MLHRYNYIMWRRRQGELLREAEHERLIHAAKLQRRHGRTHLKYAGWLGDRLISLGLKLERFGTLSKARPSPSPSPHH